MADLDQNALEAAAKVKALRNYPEDHILRRSEWAALFGPEHVSEVEEIVSAYLSALSPVVAAPVEADELGPVAWRWKKVGYGGYRYSSDKDEADHAEDVRTVEPLYSAGRIDTLTAERDAALNEIEAAKNDLRGFMTTFVREHFPNVPQWKPLPDLLGMLSQMDNASTVARDLTRRAETAHARIAELEAALIYARPIVESYGHTQGNSAYYQAKLIAPIDTALSKPEPVKQ